MQALLCVMTMVAVAVEALPLSAERLVTPALGDERTSGAKQEGTVFLVRVNRPPQEEHESSTTTTPPEGSIRQFPWPYPPDFESALPEAAKQRLVEIFEDSSLGMEERAAQINAVFDALPQHVIQQLPLPVQYERLPFDVYRRLHYIHVAPGFKWAERQQLTQNIIESLPEEVRSLMGTPRFGGPPPGFEYVLSPTIYKQLLFVHYNRQLTKEQRAELITRIMHQVPAEQIEQLPLPAGMERLPAELQRRLRALVYDYSVPQAVRAKRVRDFVEMLPQEMRPPLRR